MGSRKCALFRKHTQRELTNSTARIRTKKPSQRRQLLKSIRTFFSAKAQNLKSCAENTLLYKRNNLTLTMKTNRRLLLLLVLGVPLILHSLTAKQATGLVYHDKNANRLHDKGEPGIANVLISNGAQVVSTDKKGRYTLPVGEDTILFVIQPKSWEVPLNEQNLPQFYYNHKPAGSPKDLKYPGVAPTGPLPASIDFPLYPGSTNDAFSIFAFGDPQPYTLEEVDYYRKDIVEEARHMKEPVAGISLGDIVGDDLDLFEPMNTVTALMDRPWWNVYGNHDMNLDVEDPELADETWERIYGPATYAFQIGDVVFIAIDNVLYPNTYTDSHYMGGFTDKQLEFVKNLLAHIPTDKLIVTMVHIPLYDEGSFTYIPEHRQAFFELFEHHKHTLSLSAHTHTQNHRFFENEHDHWPHIDEPHHHYNVGTTSGSWWSGPKDERGIPITTMRDGTPNGYAILHFKGNTYSYNYKVANGAENEVMSLYCPDTVVQSDSWSNAMIGINVYNGTEQTVVEYRINGEEWKEATKKETFDPQYAYNKLADDHKTLPTGHGQLPYPINSSHQWTGSLPINLDPGVQLVEVRVTDRFGRVFEDSTSYRIIEN